MLSWFNHEHLSRAAKTVAMVQRRGAESDAESDAPELDDNLLEMIPLIFDEDDESDTGLADSESTRAKEMTAINSGMHEVPGVRLPLQTSYASPSPHAVFMYSTGGSEGTVTLQLRDADDLDDKSGGLAAVLARLQQEDATLSISYQDADMLAEGSIDVLLGTGSLHASGTGGTTATFDLFDSESGQDLTLSPQTFTSSTEAFINDNSDSLGVPGDTDTVGSSEDAKGAADSSKLAVKKPRPKASSPNRQGPQQCQVCSKVFGNASALAKHKLTHSDERKYVCSMCGKAFKRQDHLNGHMLTHRNKKPYECKAEGCGKSYCDARSLRRHTENHHSSASASSTGDEASPLAASCIQYAPPPQSCSSSSSAATPSQQPAAASAASPPAAAPAKSPSQLQQLLANDSSASSPAASSAKAASSGNDGLTKQQLDLIHQIMQQTQQQAAAAQQKQQSGTSSSSSSSGSSSSSSTSSTSSTSSNSSSSSSCSTKAASNGSSPASKVTIGGNKSRTWSVQSPGGGGAPGVKTNGVGGGQATGASAAPTSSAATPAKPQQQLQQQQQQQQDPKPVECNLCHRKFKNIPALNGHMRLHGGYFKKDSEAKKCEKKEVAGPPLQTASMSVRALIEEKIIQKRITNPPPSSQAHTTQQITFTSASTAASDAMNSVRAAGLSPYASSSPGLAGKDPPDLNIKLSSFVVPAPPQAALAEKIRRHSDSEHFVSPRTPTTDQEAVALAELLLKRSAVAVKRASSDPGHHSSNSSSASPSPQPTQQLQLSFQSGETYALSYQGEDGGYFSPSLQEEMFQQSVQDTMLLHGVDAAQLAESIQLQAASLLQDQAAAEHLQDIASLEDYQNATVNSPGVAQYQSQNSHGITQDFQAVLNSPLPVSLADFSPYGQQSPIPKDLSYQPSPSPLQQKEFVSYANSPHTMLGTNSPLPSPLAHHDSPSFTYPTPPASQEGQSPSFSHGGLVTSGLPLSSPQQNTTDSFVQSVISHGGHVPPVSSPLSAAFYTTTMSSSAAVEEALSEVLPVESLNGQGCMRSHGLGLYQSLVNPSPPPQSPLSATPVPSPLSLSSVPASSSSVSSPLPSASFTPTQGQVSFPLSPHHTLQSHMMPNSEDPLLSSSPKDFASRKKFDFGGIHSFKLVGNGMVDLGMSNSGLAGIMVDSNGELKFFQAANPSQSKGIVMSNSSSVNGNIGNPGNIGVFQKKEDPSRARLLGKVSSHHTSHYHHISSFNNSRSQRPKLQVAIENIKEEVDDDVFLSPTSIPASPIRLARKRSRPEPLYLPPQPHPSYQSRLRCTRAKDAASTGSSCLPYTPAPMLSPSRQGQGLYWQAAASPAPATWPSSTTTSQNGSAESPSPEESQQSNDSAPESDSTPHINVGPEYQSAIPKWNPDREKANREPSYEHLLWDPGISKVCTDAEVDMYLEFACCAAVPGGGRNKEYALHLLHMCHGNIHEAMLKLMQPTPALPVTHPLLAYDYCESDRWSADEMDVFHQGLLKYDKDFTSIASEIGSKTTKQCIQFYYLWKKVCPEEYKRLRLIRRRQNADFSSRMDLDLEDIKLEDSRSSIPVSDVELVTTSSESRLFVCEYPDCSASFNSRAALNGHIRIHSGSVCGRSPTPDKRPSTATPPALGDLLEEFPCKICGKVFNKVKSRSAHMKSHRPPDAEPKKPKLDPHKMESAEQTLGRAMGVSSSVGGSSGRHT